MVKKGVEPCGTSVTNLTTLLPTHAQLMANISIKEGGLGIQNPLTNAINTYMTTSKRCLQYAQEGAWLGFNKNRPQFPHTPIIDHGSSSASTSTCSTMSPFTSQSHQTTYSKLHSMDHARKWRTGDWSRTKYYSISMKPSHLPTSSRYCLRCSTNAPPWHWWLWAVPQKRTE